MKRHRRFKVMVQPPQYSTLKNFAEEIQAEYMDLEPSGVLRFHNILPWRIVKAYAPGSWSTVSEVLDDQKDV